MPQLGYGQLGHPIKPLIATTATLELLSVTTSGGVGCWPASVIVVTIILLGWAGDWHRTEYCIVVGAIVIVIAD